MTSYKRGILPEHTTYRDDGCSLHPSCLACPLPRCRYEVEGGLAALERAERDRTIRTLRDHQGATVDEIAVRFQITKRTVFRVLSAGEARSERKVSAEGSPGDRR